MFLASSVKDMITVKRLLKAVVAICGVLLLCSCAQNSTPDALSVLKQKSAPEKYNIIISSKATEELYCSVGELADALSDKTGVKCDVLYDNENVVDSVKVFEILVGNIDNSAVATEYRNLKRDDYICHAYENYIILGGKSDSASVCAVKRFVEDIVPYATDAMIMDKDSEFAHYAEYEMSDVTFCGFSLSEYKWVYSGEPTESVAGLAKDLRELIADRCGAYGELCSESVDGNKEIIFILDEEAINCSTVKIFRKAEDIYIASSTTYGLSVGAQALYDLLFSQGEKATVNVDINYELMYNVSDCGFSLAVASIFGDSSNKIDTAISFADAANSLDADIVLLRGGDDDLISFALPNISTRLSKLEYENKCLALYDSKKLSYVGCSITDGILEIVLKNNSTEQMMYVYSSTYSNENKDVSMTVTKKVQTADGGAVAVIDDIYGFGIMGEGIATQYNGILSNDAHRYIVFSKEYNFECVGMDVVDDSNCEFAFVVIDYQQTYSGGFLDLLERR